MADIQNNINQAASSGKKQLAVLIDPDKVNDQNIASLIGKIKEAKVDLIFVGGSLMIHNNFEKTIHTLKKQLDCPVIIFPGHPMQISASADAILLLSLISGRNADLLIGQHVHAAPLLRSSGLEIMPTGYILIDGDMPTTVSYISNTQPIPKDKPEIAACTAMAGEMLGLKNIYLEAGSGAKAAVPIPVIKAVKDQLSIPLIVGGGIKDAPTAKAIAEAGADIIVVGSAIEQDVSLIQSLAEAIHSVAI
ncbi:MAG: geranylgeranylglyceryl/heptaprenylglyceryl phosphate synthase [Chitinophagales bacterium]